MSMNKAMLERPVNPLKHSLIKTFAIAVLGLAAPAAAQEQQQAPGDDATTQKAYQNLSLAFSAIGAEQLDDRVKNVLASCMVENSMRTITQAMDEVMAENPERFDRANNNEMLSLMAGVCGLQPEAAEGEASAQPR